MALTGPGDELLALPPDVVTGEAVVLEVRPASLLVRGLAFALDAVVLLALGVGGFGLLALALPAADDAAAAALGLGVVVLVLVGVPTAWEALSRGRSPGKGAAGLRVVRDDGGPVRARQALVRALVGVGELFLLTGGPAAIAALATRRGQRIGDLVAGTVVVRERSSAPRPAPLAGPPELAAWAAAADIARLPEPLAAAARTALGRAPGLEGGARERLLASLRAQVLARVAPAPPPGSPDDRVLAAVLVERRERERARLLRERDRRDVLADRARRLQGL